MRPLATLAVLAVIAAVSISPASAQEKPDSATLPLEGEADELPSPPPGYKPVVPELVSDPVKVDSRWFTLRIGFVPIFDYTWFTQDQASLDQVAGVTGSSTSTTRRSGAGTSPTGTAG